jgi:hypothetical protein
MLSLCGIAMNPIPKIAPKSSYQHRAAQFTLPFRIHQSLSATSHGLKPSKGIAALGGS